MSAPETRDAVGNGKGARGLDNIQTTTLQPSPSHQLVRLDALQAALELRDVGVQLRDDQRQAGLCLGLGLGLVSGLLKLQDDQRETL